MRVRSGRSVSSGVLMVALTAALVACGGPGDLAFHNDGSRDATVSTGDEESVVSGGGGLVLLGYGCTPGDVTVVLGTGRTVVLSGPVCSDQEVVITDDDARLQTAARSDA